MKITNTENNEVFVETVNGKLQFGNPYIQQSYAETGIYVPPGLQATYGGKDFIKLDDPMFEKAFLDLYYAFEMNHEVFKLQK